MFIQAKDALLTFNVGTTQIYGKITDLKIREDMNRLQEHKSKAFSDYTEAIEKQNATIF